MRKTVFRVFTIAVVLGPAVVLTQSGQAKPATATFISKEEIDIVSSKGQGIDRTIRVVDIGHENFAIGIIHRGPMAGGVALPAGGAAANPAPAAAGAAARQRPPSHADARWRLFPRRVARRRHSRFTD